MPTFTISTNGKYQKSTSSAHGMDPQTFSDIEELRSIVKNDWTPAVFTNGHRHTDKFEFCQFLYADVDEGCSIAEFETIFSAYKFYILTSRNHQKVKPAKATKPESPAQDRFHVLFPLKDVCYDSTALADKLTELTKEYTFLDPSSKDAARFYFGFDNVEITFHDGPESMDIKDNSFIQIPLDEARESKEKIVLDSLVLAGRSGVFDDYSDWISVGTALKNEGYSVEDWLSISHSGVDESEMRVKWEGFKKTGTTGGTLVHYGRQANPGLLKKGTGLSHALSSVQSMPTTRKANTPTTDTVTPKTAIRQNDGDKIAQRFSNDQFGTRDRVAYYHGEDLRYISDREGWVVWAGNHWKVSDNGVVRNLVSRTIEQIVDREGSFYPKGRTGKGATPEEEALAKAYKEFFQYVKASRTHNHTEGTEKLLRDSHDKGLVTLENQYDKDPMLFNVMNGTVSLEDGKLYKHDRNDLCSKMGNVHFDSEAQAPKFKKMMSDIMLGREGMIDWLQQYFGYCLTGLPPDRVMAIFWGSGSNGKSSIINIASHILGSYASSARVETFIQSDSMDKIGQDIVQLRGARMIVIQETSAGQRLDTQKIKAFTGKDAIKGRYNYSKKDIEFVNTGKIILSTNHKPVIAGNDAAMWDRTNNVAFERIFSKDEKVMGLPEQIMEEESSGVLNWMIEGCLKLKNNGWKFPHVDEIAAATEEYRKEEDKMGQFIEEYCTFSGNDSITVAPTVLNKDLYSKYRDWCDEDGIKATSHVRFAKELTQGRPWITKSRITEGSVYIGIRLRRELEQFTSYKTVLEERAKEVDEDIPF